MATIQEFRQQVSIFFTKRAAALFNVLDALTTAGHVFSPVALSEEVIFQRRHSSIPDALNQGAIEVQGLGQVLYDLQPAEAEILAGYEVYAVDTTPTPRPEAETLPDRGQLKSQADTPACPGHKYSWLVRLVAEKTSWIAPQDIRRVETSTTDSVVAAAQVKTLDGRSDRPKVVVLDSLYANQVFLAVALVVKTIWLLVRLRHNRVLSEPPAPKVPGQVGAPRKHGAKFKLAAPGRPPDREETFILGAQTIVLKAWFHLHLYQLPDLVGLALRVEFLKTDGTPRYKYPLWLFWTGPLDVPLSLLCRMYLWRFAIEHAYRFCKRHLGLNANQSTQLGNTHHWMWLCALAFWQLLLLRPIVSDRRPAWYPHYKAGVVRPLTPGLVQRAALPLLLALAYPSRTVRPAGKGTGRPQGYRPTPRPRWAVVKKGQKRPKTVKKAPATA